MSVPAIHFSFCNVLCTAAAIAESSWVADCFVDVDGALAGWAHTTSFAATKKVNAEVNISNQKKLFFFIVTPMVGSARKLFRE
jgi:hypothetical protein